MAKDGYLSIRVPEDLKQDFWAFCAKLNIKPTMAVNLLIGRCLMDGNLPYEIAEPERGASGDSVLVSFRVTPEKKERFSSFCNDVLCASMSMVIKCFMVQCVRQGKIPFTSDSQGGNGQRVVKWD